jgi:hypothetical protein
MPQGGSGRPSPFGQAHARSPGQRGRIAGEPGHERPCRVLASAVTLRRFLAMQKVVGSNPIIRFARNPLQTARFSRFAGPDERTLAYCTPFAGAVRVRTSVSIFPPAIGERGSHEAANRPDPAPASFSLRFMGAGSPGER